MAFEKNLQSGEGINKQTCCLIRLPILFYFILFTSKGQNQVNAKYFPAGKHI